MSTAEFAATGWRKSSFTGGGNNGNCVEVAVTGWVAAVRDSKNPTGPVLLVSPSGVRSLIDHVQR